MGGGGGTDTFTQARDISLPSAAIRTPSPSLRYNSNPLEADENYGLKIRHLWGNFLMGGGGAGCPPERKESEKLAGIHQAH